MTNKHPPSPKTERQESSGDVGTTEADLFDVGVDHELSSHKQQKQSNPQSRSSSSKPGREQHQPNAKRQKKNEKYGFGGKKRHAKSGDAASSADLSAFPGARRMKSASFGGDGVGRKTPKTARLGKSRRKAAATGRR